MSNNIYRDMDTMCVSSTMRAWKCPVCLRIPEREIYQCPGGHSFCLNCIHDKKTCPECDVKIFGSKHGFYGVRNLLAEYLLNQMKFECHWKDHGCKTLVARAQLSKHERTCIFGPIYLCNRFSGSTDCKFRTCIHKSMNIDRILRHLEITHGNFLLKTGMEFGSICSINMRSAVRRRLESRTEGYTIPVFLEVLHFPEGNLVEPSVRELFAFVRKVEVISQGNVSLSWVFVWLTSETNEKDFSVKMKMSIKGQPKPLSVSQNETNCVPDLSWTLVPIRAPEFAEWMLNRNRKLEFPFSLPVAHINNYYVDIDDVFTVSLSVLKE